MTRIKINLWHKTFVYMLASVFISSTITIPLTWAQARASTETIAQANNTDNIFYRIRRFIFPQTSRARGAPTGRRKGAASRKGCPEAALDLTALVPEKSWGPTFAERPTFWFHVPALSEETRYGEFVLQDEQNDRQLYRTRLTLPATSGIISVNLPSNQQYNLEIDKRYRWYFRIYCDPKNPSTYVFVDGTIDRVAQNVSDANTIWYDILTNLANRLRDRPQDTQLREDWAKLLADVGLERLAKAPLLPCCTAQN
ncbi:DUF928 domain-containing protein [Fischerella sp. PCC 9605]|uniref:DUF928 domain-containing protein n=1 Tax=Fischerella sp. PCC 9605 TaxID=1173024 RepID=UPI000685DAD2|nr:DUF928 domain-containing protein [Fischerella sp. PCC 9605]